MHGAILLSVAKVAAGGALEELILRIPRGYNETVWHRLVARNKTTSMDKIELWVRANTSEYLLRASAQGAIGRTVHLDTSTTVPDDAVFVAKFTTAVVGDVIEMYAFGHEWYPGTSD